MKDALKDIGKFAVKELVAGPFVEQHYAAELEKAKDKLMEAKAIVESFEDEKDFHEVEAAAKALEAAKEQFDARTKRLVSAVRRADSAHRTLICPTRTLSPPTSKDLQAALDQFAQIAAELRGSGS